MKRSFIIIAIIISVIIAGALFLYIETGREISVENITALFPIGEDADLSGSIRDGTDSGLFPDTGQGIQNGIFAYRQIFGRPVAGFTHIDGNVSSIIRFIEKETGHIYDFNIDQGTLNKISNKTITGVQEVIWGNNGEELIVRHLNNGDKKIENLYLSFNVDAAENESSLFNFTKTLKQGSQGTDVLFLQKTLNADKDTILAETGPGSPREETNYFGVITKDAVIRFQNKYPSLILNTPGASDELGIVGTLTIQKLNEVNQRLFGVDTADVLRETNLLSLELPELNVIVSSPDRNRVFYTKNIDPGVVGITADFNGLNKNQVFSSPFTEWLALWPEKNTVTLETKPSEDVKGYLYFLNLITESFSKKIGGINGLTSITNNDVSLVFYTQTKSLGNGFTSHIYNIDADIEYILPITTLSEKCAWSDLDIIFCGVPKEIPQGVYPDYWYQGKISFNDAIWLFDAETKESAVLFDPEVETISTSIDVTHPRLTQDEQYFIFINKKDSTLWSLRLGR